MPFIGGDGWDSEKLIEIGGDAMNGTYFCTHYSAYDPSPVVQNFVTQYKKAYNVPPDALSALGYDAAMLLFDAIKRAGSTDGDKIRQALATTKNFPGVTGSITIDAERNARKPIVFLEISNGKMQYKETIQP
jgi:branched-chain amino acid transport system substrate-binding protein